MNIPVTISMPNLPLKVEYYTSTLKATLQQVIDSFHQQGIIKDRNYNVYEVRQHEKKRFIRKCLNDEYLTVLLFNWHLSSHQFTLVLRKEAPSIYLDLRKELCRSLPLESLLQRQKAIQTAEDDAMKAVAKRVDHQKKLIMRRIQELHNATLAT